MRAHRLEQGTTNMTEIITSTGNPRIVAARKLNQKKHRLQQNRFAAGGLQILAMAVEGMLSPQMAGSIKPLDVFYCEELFVSGMAPRIVDALTAGGATRVHVSQRVLESLSNRELSQGVVATFDLRALLQPMNSLPSATGSEPYLLVVLDRPQYPGNAGTLIRTADAVGAAGVILIEPAVDPFAPNSIRASMGSIFAVPIVRLSALDELAIWGQKNEIRWVGADGSAADVVWSSKSLLGSAGLILGNEGEGLQPSIQQMLHHTVRLPQRGGAESLNVSVAGGILMYEWMRVNYPDIA